MSSTVIPHLPLLRTWPPEKYNIIVGRRVRSTYGQAVPGGVGAPALETNHFMRTHRLAAGSGHHSSQQEHQKSHGESCNLA